MVKPRKFDYRTNTPQRHFMQLRMMDEWMEDLRFTPQINTYTNMCSVCMQMMSSDLVLNNRLAESLKLMWLFTNHTARDPLLSVPPDLSVDRETK